MENPAIYKGNPEHCVCCGAHLIKGVQKKAIHRSAGQKEQLRGMLKKHTDIDYAEGWICRSCYLRLITIDNKVDFLAGMCATSTKQYATKLDKPPVEDQLAQVIHKNLQLRALLNAPDEAISQPEDLMTDSEPMAGDSASVSSSHAFDEATEPKTVNNVDNIVKSLYRPIQPKPPQLTLTDTSDNLASSSLIMDDVELVGHDRKKENIEEPPNDALTDHMYTTFKSWEEADARTYLFNSKVKEMAHELGSYLSRTGNQTLPQAVWKAMTQSVTEQNLEKFLGTVLGSNTLRKAIMLAIAREYQSTSLYGLCKRTGGKISILMKKEAQDLGVFDWHDVLNEGAMHFPDLFMLMTAISIKPLNLTRLPFVKQSVPRLGMIYAILTQSFHHDCSAVQRLISHMFFSQRINHRIYDILRPLGICLSYQNTSIHYNENKSDLWTSIINWMKPSKYNRLVKEMNKPKELNECKCGKQRNAELQEAHERKKAQENLKKVLEQSENFKEVIDAMHIGKPLLHEENGNKGVGCAVAGTSTNIDLDLQVLREFISEKQKIEVRPPPKEMQLATAAKGAGQSPSECRSQPDAKDLVISAEDNSQTWTQSQPRVGPSPGSEINSGILNTSDTSNCQFQVIAANRKDIEKHVKMAQAKNLEVFVLSKDEYVKVLAKQGKAKLARDENRKSDGTPIRSKPNAKNRSNKPNMKAALPTKLMCATISIDGEEYVVKKKAVQPEIVKPKKSKAKKSGTKNPIPGTNESQAIVMASVADKAGKNTPTEESTQEWTDVPSDFGLSEKEDEHDKVDQVKIQKLVYRSPQDTPAPFVPPPKRPWPDFIDPTFEANSVGIDGVTYPASAIPLKKPKMSQTTATVPLKKPNMNQPAAKSSGKTQGGNTAQGTQPNIQNTKRE